MFVSALRKGPGEGRSPHKRRRKRPKLDGRARARHSNRAPAFKTARAERVRAPSNELVTWVRPCVLHGNQIAVMHSALLRHHSNHGRTDPTDARYEIP